MNDVASQAWGGLVQWVKKSKSILRRLGVSVPLIIIIIRNEAREQGRCLPRGWRV